MGKVRVFTRVHTAGLEPDLPFLVVDFVDGADHPVTFGNLILELARRTVIQIKVPPAVSFRSPNDLFAVGEVVPVFCAGFPEVPGQRSIREERLRFFADDRPGLCCSGVHFDHTINLMPALIVFKSECPAVLPPDWIG